MSYRSSQLQSFAGKHSSKQSSTRVRRRTLPGVALHRAVTAAADYTCERLEKRRLLSTVLTGGGDVNGVPQERIAEYLDGQQLAVRIALLGNITASFTFAHVATSGAISLGNLISPTADNVTAAAGSDLFNIDVTAASPDASISIARVALPSATTPAPRPMIPFGSPSFAFTTEVAVIVGNTGATDGLANVTPDANTGAILLGARQYVTPPGGGMPTQTGPLEQFDGVTAGLIVDPGVSMNRFFFGGTVIGRVDIGGSIDTFYAGQILTGNAAGVIQGESPADAGPTQGAEDGEQLVRNFNVSGDIANLISKGAIGTVTASSSAASGQETYLTGFRLSVGGHVGEIQAGGDNVTSNFIGSAIIGDSPTFKGLGTTQHEEEGEVGRVTGDATAFEGNEDAGTAIIAVDTAAIDAGVPSLGGSGANGGQASFNNNSAADAQLLGTLFSSTYGHGAVELEGALDGATQIQDYDDYYGIALDAGQTINVTLTTDVTEFGALSVGIFSPDAISTTTTNAGGLLVSSFDSRNVDREAGQTITLKATEPGIYYVAVGFQGDAAFNGGQSVTPLFEIDYNLAITGIKDLAIGGLKATGLINFPGNAVDVAGGTALAASLTAEHGDIGAILATGTILAGDSFGGEPHAIDAAAGNIRTLDAGGDIGAETGIIGQHFSPSLSASGNVGLLQSGGFMLVNADSNIAIGGSYQLVNCGTVMETNLVADVAIGTIRAQSVGLGDFAPIWSVNADSKNNDGVIDLIDVTGDAAGVGTFGLLTTGGPQITTGPGGNVRYMEIAPTVTVFNDAFFGGGEDAVIHYAAGVAANITDDSGTPITFTPTKARANIPGDLTSTGTSTTTGTGTNTVTSAVTGGTLSALTYGIRDKGGVVVVDMTEVAGDISVSTSSGTSTGTTGGDTTGGSTTVTSTTVVSAGDAPVSLSINTSALGTKGSAEIGTVNIVGAGETSTFDPTTQQFTAANGTFSAPEDMSISMTGRSPISVWNTVGSLTQMLVDTLSPLNTNAPALAGMGTVSNSTSGEIVNLEAEDIINLSAQTLGLAVSSATGANVSGAVLENTYPFVRQRQLIAIGGVAGNVAAGNGGNAQAISSRGALGNIVVAGNIGGVSAAGGVVGPIVALVGSNASAVVTSTTDANTGTVTTTVTPSIISGNIRRVNIGSGLGFSGTGDAATTGIFAANAIGTVIGAAGADIRGDIVATLAEGGLPLPIAVISPITGLPVTTTTGATHGIAIDAITLTGGGSLIDARIFETTAFAQVEQSARGLVVPQANPGNVGTATRFAVGTISLSGNGGIIGTEVVAAGVGTISAPNGFGMINSLLSSLNSDQIGSITLGGYGMRSDTITGQNSVGAITLTGTGKEIPVTAYSKSVRQSESGSTIDSFSTQTLDASNDLDIFLAVKKTKPIRKGATEAGVIADTTIVGTDRLTSLTAYRMIGHVTPVAITTKQTEAALLADTPAMTLNFAQSIGKIRIRSDTTRANITAGTISAFDSGALVTGTHVSVTANIADLTAGSISGSTHINATGPDGTISYIQTAGVMNGTVNSTVSIGEIVVGTDLGSESISSSGSFNELLVKGNILSGSNVRVANTLNLLNVRHNILGGGFVQAKKIGKQQIGGQVFGNIVITG